MVVGGGQGSVAPVPVVVVAQGSIVEVAVEVDSVVSGAVVWVLSGLVVCGASCPHAATPVPSPIGNRPRPSNGISSSAR